MMSSQLSSTRVLNSERDTIHSCNEEWSFMVTSVSCVMGSMPAWQVGDQLVQVYFPDHNFVKNKNSQEFLRPPKNS